MTSSPSPPPRKTLLVFAAHALVLALLLGNWPSARAVYPELLRSGLRTLVSGGEAAAVVVRPGALRADPVADSFLEGVTPDAEEPAWRVSFSTLRIGWWPFAVLAALLFASPMTARRRAAGLLVGLVLTTGYALGRLLLEIRRAEVELARGGAGAEEAGLVLFYRSATEVLSSNIVVIAVVLIGWVLLANPQRSLGMGVLGRLLGADRLSPR